jgi:hypothetical protein
MLSYGLMDPLKPFSIYHLGFFIRHLPFGAREVKPNQPNSGVMLARLRILRKKTQRFAQMINERSQMRNGK